MTDRSFLPGTLVACFAALSISVSNVALPTFYQSGGDVQAFMTGRCAATLVCASLAALLVHLVQRRHRVPGSARGSVTPWLRPQETGAALLSGTFYGAGALLVLGSIALIPVSLAILILFTFPVLTVLIACVADRQMPPPLQLGLVIAALVGVGIALDVQSSVPNPIGVVMASCGAIMVATTFVLNERLLEEADPFSSAAVMALAGLAVVGGFALATGAFTLPPQGSDGMIALGVAVAGSTLAFLAMFWAVNLIGATPTAMVMNLEPVLTIALSVWILSDVPSLQRMIGATIVIASIAASQLVATRSVILPPSSDYRAS